MAVALRSVIESDGADVLSKRDLNKILRHEFHKAGDHWMRHYRKRHFTRGAFQRYSEVYKSRGRSYAKRKERAKKHSRPLVFTGETERRSRAGTVRSTRNGFTITIPAPALNLKSRGQKVNMRAEMEFINKQEANTMGQMIARGLERQIENKRTRKRITI